MAPHRSFKIKANFGTLRIGFVEPTIWKTWRKSGRINADAERFMVSRSVPCRKLSSALHQCVHVHGHGGGLARLTVHGSVWVLDASAD
jgi:hypothetical protein